MSGKREKISIRITPNQSQVLAEMSQALNTTYSMLVRTILGDWITKNEDYIYRIIDKKRCENAMDKENREKEGNQGKEGDRYEEIETEGLPE